VITISVKSNIKDLLDHLQLLEKDVRTATAIALTRTAWKVRAAEMEDRGLVAGRALPDARDVAQVGYRAMNAGRPLAVEGTSNKLFAFGARLMPRQLAARIAQRALERTSAP